MQSLIFFNNGAIKQWLTKAFRKFEQLTGRNKNFIRLKGKKLTELNETQTMFVKWNAERLDIPFETSRQRYLSSWEAVRGGHAGSDYRRFNDLSYQTFQVFANDSGAEVYAAYQFHAQMHFLRMLSYPDKKSDESEQIVQMLADRPSVAILDYGCGLAHRSRALARLLISQGVRVTLYLVDIPTIRRDFLIWLGKETCIETVFLSATEETPIPILPKIDICFALEFFEHVYEPVMYLDSIAESINFGGILVTNVMDHQSEFMHVSPNLSLLRDRLVDLKFREHRKELMFVKGE